MRASVLIAVHDAERTIEVSIGSVLPQLRPRDELVIVDDGSTDGTVAILQKFAHNKQVKVIRQPNSGLAAALNAGLQRCSGEVLIRLDADDEMLPERLIRQVRAFSRDPGLVLVGGNIVRVGEDGTPLGATAFPTGHDQIVRDLVRGHHAICHSAAAFSADAVRRVGGYWSEGVAEDWDLYLRLSENGRLLNLPDALINYRFHTDSINARNLRDVRVGVHLAIENYNRSRGQIPPLSRTEFLESMSSRRARKIDREVFGLKHYRRALSLKVNDQRIRSWSNLLLAAGAQPTLVLRRLNARRVYLRNRGMSASGTRDK